LGGAAEVLLRSLPHLTTPVQCLRGSGFNPPNKREAVPSCDRICGFAIAFAVLRSHLWFRDRICGFAIAFAVLRSHLRFRDRICGFAIAFGTSVADRTLA